MDRREMLAGFSRAIAAAALGAQWAEGLARAAPPPSGIKVPEPRLTATGTDKANFFTAEERESIATVADLIIPADEVSPGARAAGVHDWIDFLVANSPNEVGQRWREGLAALDGASLDLAGRGFSELRLDEKRKLIEKFAEREDHPTTPGERFFVLAKQATVDGYYTSEIGLMKDLKYRGGTYVNEPDNSCPAHATSESPQRHE